MEIRFMFSGSKYKGMVSTPAHNFFLWACVIIALSQPYFFNN